MIDLKIKRTGPNTGIVMSLYPYMEETPVTDDLPYDEAMAYVKANRQDLKIYKVACYMKRKNAVRRLYKRILAHDHAEAFLLYSELMQDADKNYTYELLTGNWQPLDF